MLVNTFSAHCPKIVGSATVASLLQTSNSMFDGLRRAQPLSIFGRVTEKCKKRKWSASQRRPGASPGSTSTQLADLLAVLSAGTPGGSAGPRVPVNKYHHHPGQVHARRGGPRGSSQPPTLFL
jgi:hypothetical protein